MITPRFSLAALASALCAVSPLVAQDAPKEAPKTAPAAGTAASDARPFTTRDGKKFFATVVSRTDVAVTFKLQTGKTQNMMISALDEVSQQYVRKWTKLRDELLRNKDFADITIKDLMEAKGYQSFEFEIEGNHIFLHIAEINGKASKFMIDSGAGSTIFHVGYAKEAGLEVGPMDKEIHGVAGKQPAATTGVKSIKIGDSLITNRKYLSTELGHGGVSPDYSGILGADIMRELDAVISYKESRIFLKPPGTAPASKDAKTGARLEYRKWTSKDGKAVSAALTDKTDTDAILTLPNGSTAKVPLANLSDDDAVLVQKWSKFRDDLSKRDEFRTMTAKELLELRNYQSTLYRLSGNHVIVDGTVGPVKANILIDTGAHSGVLDITWAKGRGQLKPGPMDQVVMGIGNTGTAPAANCDVPDMKIGDCIFKARTLLACDLYRDQPADVGRDHDLIFGADFLREVDAVLSYKENRLFMRADQSDAAAAE